MTPNSRPLGRKKSRQSRNGTNFAGRTGGCMAMDDERPICAIGHVRLAVEEVDTACGFFARAGIARGVEAARVRHPGTAAAAPTSCLPKPPSRLPAGERAPFDLMVDDVDAAHQRFVADGVAATAHRTRQHTRFLYRHGAVRLRHPHQLVARGGHGLIADAAPGEHLVFRAQGCGRRLGHRRASGGDDPRRLWRERGEDRAPRPGRHAARAFAPPGSARGNGLVLADGRAQQAQPGLEPQVRARP